MLTTRERIWLKNREKRLAIGHRYYSCKYCDYWQDDEPHKCGAPGYCIDETGERWDCHECEVLGGLFEDDDSSIITGYDYGPKFRDAAEFEAKVTELMSDWAADGLFALCESCPYWNNCSKESKKVCRRKILKGARLTIEEKMDK